MRRLLPPVLLFAVLAAFGQPAWGQEASASVLVVKVDGSIDRTIAAYLRNALEDAEASGSTVVIQLDSAGTLDVDGVALARRIHGATVPVVVWVGPTPAKARGAALLLLYAASASAVAPGSGIGPLPPLDLAGGAEPSAASVEDLATSWLQERGRATPVAFPNEPVAAQAALDGNIAELAATSVTDLLDKLDGRTVGTAEGDVTLRTRIALAEGEEPVTVRFLDLGPVARVLHAAASPTWIYVLLAMGLAAIAFELTQPGFGFAGFSGVGMVALAAYGLVVVPFSWIGLGLLVGGVGMMALDVVLRRFGPLTWAGLVAFGAGSLVVFGGVSPLVDVSAWLIGSFVLASLLYYGFGLTVAVQSRDRITSTQRGLIGLVGETRGELKPEGPVHVKGAVWRGRSVDGPIPGGTRVRVRGVDGLILRVEPEPGPAPEEEPPTPGDGPPAP